MKPITLSLLILFGSLGTMPQRTAVSDPPIDTSITDLFAPSTQCRRQIVPNVSVVSLLSPRSASSLECESCCNAAEAAYQECRRTRSTLCNCLSLARSACLGNGCGPCQCCADWDTRGVIYNCWE